MSEEEVGECRRALLSISSGYYKRLKGAHKAYVKRGEFKEFVENATLECLAKVLRKLAILAQTKVYLLWKNPDRARLCQECCEIEIDEIDLEDEEEDN